MGITETGHGKLRDRRYGPRRNYTKPDDDRDQFAVDAAPRVRAREQVRLTYGGYSANGFYPPCGKCGCEFLNVACPRSWPIGTVALTCAKCGSIVEYVDGLLIMTVCEALKEQHGKEWIVRNRIAVQLQRERGVSQDVVLMAFAEGLTLDEIVTALDIQEVQQDEVAG